MNPLVIFLLVIIVFVLIFLIYRAIYPPSTQLLALTNLNATVPAMTITDGSPSQVSVSYGVWVYVNNWNQNKKMIFQRSNDVSVYFDDTTPTLYVDMTITAAPGTSVNYPGLVGSVQTIKVTDNFPIQKWVFIIVSFDGRGFADVYLDGKLVKSSKIFGIRQNIPDANTPLYFGNSSLAIGTGNAFIKFDAYISQFVRYLYTMDPQTAWNLYMAGNGNTGSLLSQYNLDIRLLKNGVTQNDIQVF